MSAPWASAWTIWERVMWAIWMSPPISAADATDPPPRPFNVTSRPYWAKMPLSRARNSGRWAPPSGYETLSLVAGATGAVAAGLAAAVLAAVAAAVAAGAVAAGLAGAAVGAGVGGAEVGLAAAAAVVGASGTALCGAGAALGAIGAARHAATSLNTPLLRPPA